MARVHMTPWWRQLAGALTCPARPAPLLLITVLSAFGAVTFSPGVLSGAIQVAMLVITLRYGYAVIIDVARGADDPPALSLALLNDGLEMPLKQFGVIILFAMVYGLCARLGDTVAGLSLLAMKLLAPATAIIIAFENSWWRAVNPLYLLRVIRPILPAYLLLCLTLGSIWLLAQGLFSLLSPAVTGKAKIFVYDLSVMYFLLVLCAVIGLVVRRYRGELGLAERFTDADTSAEQLDSKHLRQ